MICTRDFTLFCAESQELFAQKYALKPTPACSFSCALCLPSALASPQLPKTLQPHIKAHSKHRAVSTNKQTRELTVGSAEAFLESIQPAKRILFPYLTRDSPKIIEHTMPLHRRLYHFPLKQIVGHHVSICIGRGAV